MPLVFISYRRDDSAGYAGRLFDILSARFGAEQVFMDQDDIHAGDDFITALDHSGEQAVALIALIGKAWVNQRLFDPDDFVRLEIVTAFQRSTRIFPVLVGGALMPPPASLPPDLAQLSRLQAVSLNDASFHRDAEGLMTALETVIVKPADIAGTWRADVKYSWGDTHPETFDFEVDGEELFGTASYVRTPRPILEGKRNGARLTFQTKSQTMLGNTTYEEKHTYSGKLVGQEIQFRLTTESGYDSKPPISFKAVQLERYTA